MGDATVNGYEFLTSNSTCTSLVYSKGIDFCISICILQPFYNWVLVPAVSLCHFFQIFFIFFLSNQSVCHLFSFIISLYYLGISSTMTKGHGYREHSCPVFNLCGKALSFSPLGYGVNSSFLFCCLFVL